MQWISSVVDDQSNIHQARSLLYQYYVKKLKWDINHDNPSRIKIRDIAGKRQIVDDYDGLSTWFSVKNDAEIVASARLCKKDANGLLEIERYIKAKKVLGTILKQSNLIELNREATSIPRATYHTPRLLLLKLIINYCLVNNYSLITTCNIPEWMLTYKQASFPKLNCRFKYSELDKESVEVYLAKKKDLEKMLLKINGFFKTQGECHDKASSVS